MVDIFDYNYDKTLTRPITDNSTGVVYDTVDQTINVGSILTGGSLTLKSLNIGGLVKQVAPGDDLQAAIDSVNREGGGTIQLLAKTYTIRQDLNMKAGVYLKGSTRAATVLDFDSGAFSIISNTINNWGIRDLTIQSSSSNGIEVLSCGNWFIDNVYIQSCSDTGIYIYDADGAATSFFKLRDVELYNNSQYQIHIEALGDGFAGIANFSLENCKWYTGGGFGLNIEISSANGIINTFELNNCSGGSHSNKSLSVQNHASIIGGVAIGGSYSTISDDMPISFVDSNNSYNNLTKQRKIESMKNSTGATILAGSSVVHDVSNGVNNIATTTTNGDTKVVGVVQTSVADDSTAPVIRFGKTTLMLVKNGVSSITVGDWISTYSEAYYAKKAGSGEMAFALALETPTTSTAVIDALLVSPRLLP